MNEFNLHAFEALATLTVEELCHRVHATKKDCTLRHNTAPPVVVSLKQLQEHVSRPCIITHLFPVIGVDGHVRLHVLTEA
eukprot:3681119-Amphidinium_carterae.2